MLAPRQGEEKSGFFKIAQTKAPVWTNKIIRVSVPVK